jgi:hypothetical protein
VIPTVTRLCYYSHHAETTPVASIQKAFIVLIKALRSSYYQLPLLLFLVGQGIAYEISPSDSFLRPSHAKVTL